MRRGIAGEWDGLAETQQHDWFAATANAFVNLFKPQLRRLLEEQQRPVAI